MKRAVKAKSARAARFDLTLTVPGVENQEFHFDLSEESN
jgi:hypothetical protein